MWNSTITRALATRAPAVWIVVDVIAYSLRQWCWDGGATLLVYIICHETQRIKQKNDGVFRLREVIIDSYCFSMANFESLSFAGHTTQIKVIFSHIHVVLGELFEESSPIFWPFCMPCWVISEQFNIGFWLSMRVGRYGCIWINAQVASKWKIKTDQKLKGPRKITLFLVTVPHLHLEKLYLF